MGLDEGDLLLQLRLLRGGGAHSGVGLCDGGSKAVVVAARKRRVGKRGELEDQVWSGKQATPQRRVRRNLVQQCAQCLVTVDTLTVGQSSSRVDLQVSASDKKKRSFKSPHNLFSTPSGNVSIREETCTGNPFFSDFKTRSKPKIGYRDWWPLCTCARLPKGER